MFGNLKRPGIFQDQISVALIGGAFILIAVILAIHFYGTSTIVTQSNSAKPPATNEEKVTASNLNLFSIVLTLFGAWVGAVLAFYFGSKSLDRAYSSLSQAQDSISNFALDGRLEGVKISEIIAKNPDSLKIMTFKLVDKISKIVKDAKDSNYKLVMITDDSGRSVLGLLFISDLLKATSLRHWKLGIQLDPPLL